MLVLQSIRISLGEYPHLFKLKRPGFISSIIGSWQSSPFLTFKFQKHFNSSQDGEGIVTRGAVVKLAHQKYQLPFQPDDTVPIIILHGLLGSKSNWHSLAKAIHEGTYNRKVITLDARNHGDSPHVQEFSYEDMVCDLLKFLNDQNMTKASFIGHSMGGRVCMLFALLMPEMVHSMVVVDISPLSVSPKMMAIKDILEALLQLDIDPNATLYEARKQATEQLKSKITDYQMLNFLLTNMVKRNHDPGQWKWKINIKAIHKNFISNICRFPVPSKGFSGRTLFVAGGNSDYVKPEDTESIQKVFENAEFTFIEGAGHWVHADKPKEFLTAVIDFLNRDGPVSHSRTSS